MILKARLLFTNIQYMQKIIISKDLGEAELIGVVHNTGYPKVWKHHNIVKLLYYCFEGNWCCFRSESLLWQESKSLEIRNIVCQSCLWWIFLTGMTFHWAPSKGSLAEMWDRNLEFSKIQKWRSNLKKSLISIFQIRSDYVDDLVDNYPSPVKHYDQVLTIMTSKLLMSMSYLRIWPQSGWGAAPSLSASSCKCRRWHSCYRLGDFLWFCNWKNTKLKKFVLR